VTDRFVVSQDPSLRSAAVAPPTDKASLALPVHHRVRHGLRTPANWWQLIRFAAVGASGYVVNLLVYTLVVHPLGGDYRIAAVAGFIAGVVNNFFWNRHWTFAAHDGHAGFQALRFFVVSLVAFGFSFLILTLLVDGAGLAKVPAQAIALVLATPLNFVGNKLWSFGR
jgi:putative flippase GtrA